MHMLRANPPGQPTMFSPEITKKLIEGIRLVLVLKQACGHARITYQSLWNWLNIGKADIEAGKYTDYAQFFYDVKGAQCEEVAELQANIRKAIPNWQSQAWLLERCFRDDFGQGVEVIQEIRDKFELLEKHFEREQNAKPEGL
jgi:hypothetical protein